MAPIWTADRPHSCGQLNFRNPRVFGAALFNRLRSPLLRLVLVAALLLTAVPAQADQIVAVPTSWRLQDYTNGGINLWFTGSQCTNGGLVLLPSVPDGSKDRLYSLILTAKTTNRPVGIFYHFDGTNCVIDSFYTDGPN